MMPTKNKKLAIYLGNMKSIQFEKSETVPTKLLTDFVTRNVELLGRGKWQLTFEKPNRTDTENRTFWGWLRLISEETGNDQQALYKHYCEQFNPQGCTYFADGRFSRGGTSELNTKQFAQFLTEIKADVSAELGIILPTAEDAAFNDFYNQYVR